MSLLGNTKAYSSRLDYLVSFVVARAMPRLTAVRLEYLVFVVARLNIPTHDGRQLGPSAAVVGVPGIVLEKS